MKVLVAGAAGKTGKLVVERAVAAGHQVTAFLHKHDDDKKREDPAFPAGVEIIHGDVRNPSRLDTAMAGCNAVIDCIGGTKPFLKTDLEAGSAQTLVDGMFRNGVKRILAISALGVADSGPGGENVHQGTWFYEHILIPTFLHGAAPDKANMEAEIEKSGLEYIIVRPPMLNDHDATGQVEVVGTHDTAHKLTRADLAQFLVDQLTSFTYLNQIIVIANS